MWIPRPVPTTLLLAISCSLLLSFTAFVCLARSSFFVQLRKLLSVCPLPALVCLLLLLLFLLLHCHFSLHFSVFFGSHTHTLAHCIRLCLSVFYCTFSLSSFCHHSPVSHCYLKKQSEQAPSKVCAALKLPHCCFVSLVPLLPLSLALPLSLIRGNLIVLHTFRGYRFPAVALLVIIMPQPSSSHSHYK